MASLIKRMKKGNPYYYIVESKRVNGKPRIVKQTYLGTIEKILENHHGHTAPIAHEVELTNLGVAALWDVAVSLNLPEMIDDTFRKRRQGPTMSQFLILAAIDRAFAPCSKAKISEWYEKTALRTIWQHKSSSFTSQHFWNAMDRIDLDKLAELEKKISLHVAKKEQLSPKALLYDCTNYFTYIDSLNTRNTEAQRGRNKQGRNNLRQLGLSVAVTPDFHIPLFHCLYPGNINDITQLHAVYDDLVDRFHDLSSGRDGITLIMDKGNMSEEMLFLLQDQNIYIIGAASTSNHPDLRDIGLDQFRQLDCERLSGISAYRTQKEIMGYEWTIVIEHSTSLAAKQYQAFSTDQAKAIVKLESLCKQLRRRELPRATVKSVEARVKEILKAQHLKKIVNYNLSARDAYPVLNYSLNYNEIQSLMNHTFGRTVLITNRGNWTNEDIIFGYRGQFEVENFFRESKNTEYCSFQPPRHWTDQKLHVHAFYCVLALCLVGILRRRLSLHEMNLTTGQLLEQLNGIQEATLLYPPFKSGPSCVSYCLVRPNSIQKKLISLLNLDKYAHCLENNGKTG